MHKEKKRNSPYLTLHRNQLKSIRCLNVSKNMKLLEENIGKIFQDIYIDKKTRPEKDK